MSVLLVTSLGDIVVDLHADRCPLTTKNFLKLCKMKYYNGCLFHTVQKDFTAQTGDPTGTGTGGDSIYKFLYGEQARFFSDEIHLDLKHSKMGTVAMASAGENLNASQFYITLRDDLDYLDGKHTVFGEVAEGFETLARINEAYVDEDNRPYKNIRIKHTYILEDPFDDPSQLSELIPDASPEGKPKDEVDDKPRLEDDWVPMDEQLGTTELEEVLRAKQAHSSAVVLESIGDIPDAEIKPPDNVLFVCKLNPVTEDEDLHTIFSRFGTVVSADVIRDFKTGDSLCYAFIEFETNEACEQAYFKMDNALIDDRRIHVDFSQSVSKLWSQYKRKDNQGKGRGCFKCGAVDHIAKDCTGGADVKQPSKFILKENNRQRGGNNDSKYEMVFDEDTPATPGREKRHRSHDADDLTEKQKPKRPTAGDLKHKDEEKDSGVRHKDSDRSRPREDMIREDKATRSYGSRRDQDQPVERVGRQEHKERPEDINRGRGDDREHRKRYAESGDRRDDRDHRKRYEESGDRRDDRGGYNKKIHAEGGDRREDREYRKREVESGDWRNDRDYRKRDAGGDRRDDKDYKRDDAGGDRRNDREQYRKRDDAGGERRDERENRKREAESDRRDRRDVKEEHRHSSRRSDRG